MTDGRFLREVWRRMAATTHCPDDVADIDAWRQRVAHNAMTEHADTARALLHFVPDASPSQIVSALRAGWWPHELRQHIDEGATIEAQRQAMARSMAPTCGRCRDTGYLDVGPDGFVLICDHGPAEDDEVFGSIVDRLVAVRSILREAGEPS